MRKPKVTARKAREEQRRFILRELSKDPPTRVKLIADALEVTTQRIYQYKAEFIISGELKP